ncbi:acyl-CoA thioesterase [Pseudalkalibacillus caeni]|uniref:Acyl-CoA thioesterase n=1 Tax=Exobacillus caeni TaxID=2574798 RepID=A0A5R9FBN1_9BACL|nr:thioesterase family protein [Pseudalkalibacillus caeni]TLS38293.1 acyl-CoA thioesterase [Pseudalkalibacillus caeni]
MVFTSEIKVRFAETDALGHVNNSSYFIYFEQARIEFLEHLGCNMNMEEWKFILASISCDFLNQGYFNQILSAETSVSRIGNKSFGLTHTIYDKDTRTPIAKSDSAMIYFDFKEQKSKPIPDELKNKLEAYLLVKADA